MKLTIYTDGSSRGNPGKGGWGTIVITDKEVIELGGREDHTTNNRMELMGAIIGLREIGDNRQRITEVDVCTDSEYVKKGMTEWIENWIKKGWKTTGKKKVLNQDLWEKLKKEEDRLKKNGVKIKWVYVPAHSGISLNERADQIATMCADDDANLELYRGPKSEYTFS